MKRGLADRRCWLFKDANPRFARGESGANRVDGLVLGAVLVMKLLKRGFLQPIIDGDVAQIVRAILNELCLDVVRMPPEALSPDALIVIIMLKLLAHRWIDDIFPDDRNHRCFYPIV